MLILTRKTNERIMIGDEIEVSVVEIRGDQVKLGIVAPRKVKVHRREVFDAIQDENRAAAEGVPTDLSGLSGLIASQQPAQPPQQPTQPPEQSQQPPERSQHRQSDDESEG